MPISIFPNDIPIIVNFEYRTLSGNVLVDSSPVARPVFIHKNDEVTPSIITSSDPVTGDWSATVVANVNDMFRVVVVGEPGEYSKIFEDVVAG